MYFYVDPQIPVGKGEATLINYKHEFGVLHSCIESVEPLESIGDSTIQYSMYSVSASVCFF